MARTFEEKSATLKKLAALFEVEGWPLNPQASIPELINSGEPIIIIYQLIGHFFESTLILASKGDIEGAIAHYDKIHHLMNAATQLKKTESLINSAQKKGGIARHAKTREIKGFLMKKWEEKQTTKTKRGFARDLLPDVLEMANKLNHRFPDDHAALDFITKNLPKAKKDA